MTTTNAQLFRAFKLARGLLEKGEFDFICYALEALETEGDISLETAKAAKDIIHTRLEGAYTYGDWLARSLYAEAYSRYIQGDDTLKREPRIQWLSALLQEFSQ